jgi:hypothetical protein
MLLYFLGREGNFMQCYRRGPQCKHKPSCAVCGNQLPEGLCKIEGILSVYSLFPSLLLKMKLMCCFLSFFFFFTGLYQALITYMQDEDAELKLMKDTTTTTAFMKDPENNWIQVIDCLFPAFHDLKSVCGIWIRMDKSSKLYPVFIRNFNGYVYTSKIFSYKKDLLYTFLSS